MSFPIRLTSSFKFSNLSLLAFFLLLAASFSLQNIGGKLDNDRSVHLATDNFDQNKALLVSLNLGNFDPTDLADQIEAIAIDAAGAIYVVGQTAAPGFPLVNPYQANYGGGESDGFLTVFAPDGQSLLFSTYLGGSGKDEIKDIAFDSAGRIFLTGTTSSSNFPLRNPYQTAFAGDFDGFVTVFEPGFLNLYFSTYIGGDYLDYPESIVIDAGGAAHIVGYTSSTNFPVQNPIQTNQPGEDIFVTGFAANGQSLIYSTYIGGAEDERPYEIVLGSDVRKYFTGYT
jgi:hypothetical protein